MSQNVNVKLTSDYSSLQWMQHSKEKINVQYENIVGFSKNPISQEQQKADNYDNNRSYLGIWWL